MTEQQLIELRDERHADYVAEAKTERRLTEYERLHRELSSVLNGLQAAVMHASGERSIEDKCRTFCAYLQGWLDEGQPEVSEVMNNLWRAEK